MTIESDLVTMTLLSSWMRPWYKTDELVGDEMMLKAEMRMGLRMKIGPKILVYIGLRMKICLSALSSSFPMVSH